MLGTWMNNKTFLLRSCSGLIAALVLATAAQATPQILDWDAQTWLPEGNTNLSESYTTGGGDVTVTFGGNTAELDQAVTQVWFSPSINQQNTGGLV
ncbi:MAG: hypothetical protein OEQ74_05290, partial [Gammaproteobacteria bacterium]|nr:hypothetical protein [Gammaproteobacteria bacterium]